MLLCKPRLLLKLWCVIPPFWQLLHVPSANVGPRVQVACERYDAKALLKKWDGCYITVCSSLLAFGSTEDKTISRALGEGGSAATADKVMLIDGCVSAAVARDGRMHVMSVSFPTSLGLPEQFFSFTSATARDAFMRALQSK